MAGRALSSGPLSSGHDTGLGLPPSARRAGLTGPRGGGPSARGGVAVEAAGALVRSGRAPAGKRHQHRAPSAQTQEHQPGTGSHTLVTPTKEAQQEGGHLRLQGPQPVLPLCLHRGGTPWLLHPQGWQGQVPPALLPHHHCDGAGGTRPNARAGLQFPPNPGGRRDLKERRGHGRAPAW